MSEQSLRFPVIDAHLHAVDFLQETHGLRAALRAMDAADVEAAVVFGMPVAKAWSEWDEYEPTYYLSDNSRCYPYSLTDAMVAEEWLALDEDERRRFVPLLCGLDPSDKHAVRHVQRVDGMYPGVFRGIGELLLRHDDLTNLTDGQPARANHPGLFDVYAYAGERDWPVLVHQDLSGVGRHDVAIYLHEFVEVLERFPKTTFVWAHCGCSRRVRVREHRATVETLLADLPNLCVDYSWIVFDQLICPDGEPEPHWVAMTERYSDRICLGSDLFGDFEKLGQKLARYAPLIEGLSDEAAGNICHATARRVYGIGEPAAV